MSLLEISHLSKSFDGLLVVDDLSFHVDAGEVFGFLGPNGAGKTTTMSIVAGLLTGDTGTVTINGQLFDSRSYDLRHLLGVVPQDLAIYPDLTAYENLAFFGSLYGLQSGRLRERIDAGLEETGLTTHAHRLAGTFSGGMKRRLNFAASILHEPQVLLLDEPTVGVDPQSRSHLLNSVRRLSSQGMATVYASHYMEEVEAVCQRVAIIDHGRLQACGHLDDLLSGLSTHVRFRLSGLPAELVSSIDACPGVEIDRSTTSKTEGVARGTGTDATLAVSVSGGSDSENLSQPLKSLLGIFEQHHVELRAIETAESNLERLFLQLTGHSLRD